MAETKMDSIQTKYVLLITDGQGWEGGWDMWSEGRSRTIFYPACLEKRGKTTEIGGEKKKPEAGNSPRENWGPQKNPRGGAVCRRHGLLAAWFAGCAGGPVLRGAAHLRPCAGCTGQKQRKNATRVV